MVNIEKKERMQIRGQLRDEDEGVGDGGGREVVIVRDRSSFLNPGGNVQPFPGREPLV